MDNRITKKRLSAFLSYEWILVIVICVAMVAVWELIYTVASVKLSVGQRFKYYFDVNVFGSDVAVEKTIDDDSVFSYDVLEYSGEQLSTAYNVLANRLATYDGDVMFTDCRDNSTAEEKKEIRAKFVVDNYYGYSFEVLLKDAQNYLLENFMKDGLTAEKVFSEYNLNNFDRAKIEQTFRNRMKKDNRFRKEADIQNGVGLEQYRVQKLYAEVIDFSKLLSLKETHPDLFMVYTMYEQSIEFPGKIDVEYFKRQYQKEIDAGRVNQIYALKLDALAKYKTGNTKTDPSNYVVYYGEYTAKDVCITVLDFKSEQPHLQFETISFINAIVRDCSNLLDA